MEVGTLLMILSTSFLEVEPAQFAELLDQDGLDVFEDALARPLPEPAPAGAAGRQVHGDVLPPGAGAEEPQDALQALPVIRPGAAALGGRRVLGEVRGDPPPLLVG